MVSDEEMDALTAEDMFYREMQQQYEEMRQPTIFDYIDFNPNKLQEAVNRLIKAFEENQDRKDLIENVVFLACGEEPNLLTDFLKRISRNANGGDNA